MAVKQLEDKKSSDRTSCPRCGGVAVFIDAKTIRWLNCTKCKFKKLMKKDVDSIEVKPLLNKD